jgi:hypothetical protein
MPPMFWQVVPATQSDWAVQAPPASTVPAATQLAKFTLLIVSTPHVWPEAQLLGDGVQAMKQKLA